MRIDSLPSLPTYAQGGPTFKASSDQVAGLKPLVEDVQPTRHEDVSKIMEQARQHLKDSGLNIRMSKGEGSKNMQIEVFNPETNEVIRRFPPDEIIKLGESIKKMNGLVMNRNL